MRAALASVSVAAALLFAAAAGAQAATHEITIEGMQFKPAQVEVKPGDKVVWRNKDLVPHTATAKGVFDSGAINANASWTWTVPGKAGRVGYVCIYHPGMAGVVVVK
jgi:plastocyanin